MRSFLLACFMFVMAACGPKGPEEPDQDRDTVPDSNDCYPTQYGGGRISNCDCPNNKASPASCDTGVEHVDTTDTNVDDTGIDDTDPEATTWYFDSDGDGYGDPKVTYSSVTAPPNFVANAIDCNDGNPYINPDAVEVCNEIDDDCNEVVDEDVTTVFYADEDDDGYGDAGDTIMACSVPDGYARNDMDCDDANPLVHTDNFEFCDGLDNDCNGLIDDDADDVTTWYEDADSDGFGSDLTTTTCEMPTGYATVSGDCDDANSGINPDTIEICNGLDDDCNGGADTDALDMTAWYLDYDGDSFGNSLVQVWNCAAPTGYVVDATDCDDLNAAVNTDATEVCNGLDDDCNGTIDGSDAVDIATWYVDMDHDSYGDSAYPLVSCDQPRGYVADATDCDDVDASTYPGVTEYCDGVDNDCNSVIDEDSAADATTRYPDLDGDGYGDGTSSGPVTSCEAPIDYVDNSTDCDDTNSRVYPDAAELCDGVDNDCNSVIDDGVDYVDWFVDADSDSFGDPTTAINSCSAMSGRVLNGTDCDDSDATVNPAAEDVCEDGTDQDCDGSDATCPVIPEGPAVDEDADGYSTLIDCNDSDASVNPAAEEICGDGVNNDCVEGDLDCNDVDDDSDGQTENEGDCDDSDASIFTGAGENCDDGIDNDCNGSVDYLDTDCSAYVDNDGDGYAGADCDDTNTTVNPGATEIPYNGIDENCDGTDLIDADGDGYDYTLDCDETSPDIHPDTEDVCENGIDEDCNGSDATCPPVEPGPAVDEDADGYSTILDCDDINASVNPGMPEVANGVDDNCDGLVDEGTGVYDDDGDGYTEAGGDCDDSNANIYPEANEYCDGVDNDCDGTVDEAAALDADLWFYDYDGDGYGDPMAAAFTCELDPENYVTDSTDCNDSSAAAFPGNPEVCTDSVDNDCNGDVDYNDDACASMVDADGDGYAASIDCDDTDPTHSTIYEFYSDADGDGCPESVAGEFPVYGTGCEAPAGQITYPEFTCTVTETIGDCNDTDPDIYIGASDVCEDEIDQDCNGSDATCPPVEPTDTGDTSEPEDTGTPTGTDADGDGVTIEEGDCNDTDSLVNPLAIEACSGGVDEDCDHLIDETTCLGTIDCTMNVDGITLEVTVNGNISGGLQMPLAGTITTVGIEGYTSGGRFTTVYLGDWTNHELLVYPDSRFMVYAEDSSSVVQYIMPELWNATGLCAIINDGLGGWVVVATE